MDQSQCCSYIPGTVPSAEDKTSAKRFVDRADVCALTDWLRKHKHPQDPESPLNFTAFSSWATVSECDLEMIKCELQASSLPVDRIIDEEGLASYIDQMLYSLNPDGKTDEVIFNALASCGILLEHTLHLLKFEDVSTIEAALMLTEGQIERVVGMSGNLQNWMRSEGIFLRY